MMQRDWNFCTVAMRVLIGLTLMHESTGIGQGQETPPTTTKSDDLAAPSSQSHTQDNRRSAATPLLAQNLVSFELHGRIEDEDGMAASDAKLIAVRLGSGHLPNSRKTTIVNHQGEFAIELNGAEQSNSNWLLLGLKERSSGTASVSVAIHKSNHAGGAVVEFPAAPISIRLSPGCVIKGTIYDEASRKPVPLARIYSHQGQMVRTDRTGRYELHGVPQGIETLLVTGPGMARQRIMVDVSARSDADLDVFLTAGGVLRGRIVDQHDSPVPWATVSCYSGSSILSQAMSVSADELGQFEWDGFPLKTLLFPLRLEAPGYADGGSEMFVIRSTKQPTEMTLRMVKIPETGVAPGVAGLRHHLAGDNRPPTGAIRGRVVDAEGQPVRNFVVNLLAPTILESRDTGSFAAPERSFTDDDGRFVIGALDQDRRYRVAVIAKGMGRAVIEPIYARAIEQLKPEEDLEFRLKPAHQLDVRVIDAETRAPLSQVMVGMLQNRQKHEPFEWNLILNGAHTEWTSEAGTATFSGLSADKGPVFIEQPGYARFHTHWDGAAEDPNPSPARPLEIALKRESRLQLRMTNLEHRKAEGVYAQIKTSENSQVYSPMATAGTPAVIDLKQLPAGRQQVSIFDTLSAEPWAELAIVEVDLKPGDNLVEVDLSAPIRTQGSR